MTTKQVCYDFAPRFADRGYAKGEGNHEEEIPGRGACCIVFDDRSSSSIRARCDAGRKRPRIAIPGNDEEKHFGGDERALRSSVELQTGAGPLVGGASDGTYRGGGGFYSGDDQGKGHDVSGGRSRPRREENRRSGAHDGSGPFAQGTGTRATVAQQPFWLARRLGQAFRGKPRDHGEFSEVHRGAAGSRDGQSIGEARWL